MATKTAPQTHHWKFYRAGGVDQVRLDRGADIFHLDQLDQKLWVALSCPTKGLEFDARTLELLDSDRDAHVRPPEILAAVKWLRQVLKSADELVKGVDGVALANLRDDTDEGRAVAASAKRILASLGRADAKQVTVADAVATAEVLAKAEWNGDGVVAPAAIRDPQARAVAEEIVATTGGVVDRSGAKGLDAALLERFFADCAAHVAWHDSGEHDAARARPFGADSAEVAAATQAVRAKVDDYFGRVRLADFDPRAIDALNQQEQAYLEVAARDFSIEAREIEHFPLARIAAGQALSLTQGLNPAWSARIATFRSRCLKGAESLKEADWRTLCAKVDGYLAWAAGKAGAAVEGLGIERLRTILQGSTRAALQAAIDADLAVAGEIAGMEQVEKLTRLHRDFAKLLNNYVSFTDFYARRGAIFQAGTLHLDGRALELCFQVGDAAKHGTLAPMSKTYLAYVDCTRPGAPKQTVACAFTAGDSDNLFVGRNGIFYDRKGQDWDATISKLVENPISVRQAFWSPYKKVLRWIEETIAKRAAAADEASTAKLQTSAAAAGEAAKTGEAKGTTSKFDVGVVAALGVAVGGITAALTGVLNAFFGLGLWIPAGLIGLMLAISGPSMLIAWLKLRQRNLGPILDANGWAVNTLTRVNIPLGGSLTALPKLPAGAERSMVDPYAPKASPWPKVLLALLLSALVGFALYRTNVLHNWFPEHVPAYVSSTFEGPSEVTVGTATVELTLGSGATEVTVTYVGKDSAVTVPVVDHKVTVPTADLAAGDRVTVTDPSTGKTHALTAVAPAE
jgi:hypothetical protein